MLSKSASPSSSARSPPAHGAEKEKAARQLRQLGTSAQSHHLGQQKYSNEAIFNAATKELESSLVVDINSKLEREIDNAVISVVFAALKEGNSNLFKTQNAMKHAIETATRKWLRDREQPLIHIAYAHLDPAILKSFKHNLVLMYFHE